MGGDNLMRNINSLPSFIRLGNQRDFGHTIQFDLTAWDDLNADDWKITYMRPGESVTYPVPDGDVSVADNILTWTISEAVTAINGTGSVVIGAYRGGEMLRHSARIMTSIGEGHEPAGEAPDPVADWIDDANAVMGQIAGYAESASASASEASGYADQAGQVLTSVDTLYDETKIFRDDAEDFAQAAHGSEQTASEKAGQAESAMGAAIAAADEAGRYYASLIGTELEVDVINGTLNLYSAGDYSPIDIELNDRSLEVWRA